MKKKSVARMKKGALLIFTAALLVCHSSVETRAAQNKAENMVDVNKSSWSYSYIQKAFNENILNGIDSTHFAPGGYMTRAMLATAFYRMAGSPEAGTNSFWDVPDDCYYSKAVSWLNSQKIITGYEDGSFKPETPVTREQAAVIAQRFRARSENVQDRWDVSGYIDSDKISPFAFKAMEWAVGRRIIAGTGKVLNPLGYVTREQAAKILVTVKEGHGDYSQKLPVGEEYYMELQDVKTDLEYYQSKASKAQSGLDQAKKAYNDIQSDISSGSAGFFKEQGKTSSDARKAYEIIMDKDGHTQDDKSVNVFAKTTPGAADDATSLENMDKALQMIKTYYNYRSLNNQSRLKLSHSLMAIAQKQCNWSVDISYHSFAYLVGENLAWGDRPFDFWYDQEKEMYDAGNRDHEEVGHFLNITSNQYTETGMAVNTAAGESFYGQTFSYEYMWRSDQTYSYEDYCKMFYDYKNGLDNKLSQAKYNLEQAQIEAKELDRYNAQINSLKTRLNSLKALV